MCHQIFLGKGQNKQLTNGLTFTSPNSHDASRAKYAHYRPNRSCFIGCCSIPDTDSGSIVISYLSSLTLWNTFDYLPLSCILLKDSFLVPSAGENPSFQTCCPLNWPSHMFTRTLLVTHSRETQPPSQHCCELGPPIEVCTQPCHSSRQCMFLLWVEQLH